MTYLLDPNICVFLLRDRFDIGERIREVGGGQVVISEITVAELTYGAYLSNRPAHHLAVLQGFLSATRILPVQSVLDRFGAEKARLRRAGTPVSDFDILIGVTAVEHGLTMVSDNERDLSKD